MICALLSLSFLSFTFFFSSKLVIYFLFFRTIASDAHLIAVNAARARASLNYGLVVVNSIIARCENVKTGGKRRIKLRQVKLATILVLFI